jgi:hypothetical protein
LRIIHSFFTPIFGFTLNPQRNNNGAAKVASFSKRVMKMFENKEFYQAPEVQEAAPADATYNFGGSTAAGVTAKVATYLASAFVLGGSIFASNQIMSPANLQHADQANAASQSQGAEAAGSEADATAAALAEAEATATAEATAAAQAAAGEDATSFSASSHSASRSAAKTSSSTPSADPTPAADPSPSADPVVADPTPPSFSHGNTSSATPTAGNSASGSGSNFGDDNEDEGDDD